MVGVWMYTNVVIIYDGNLSYLHTWNVFWRKIKGEGRDVDEMFQLMLIAIPYGDSIHGNSINMMWSIFNETYIEGSLNWTCWKYWSIQWIVAKITTNSFVSIVFCSKKYNNK